MSFTVPGLASRLCSTWDTISLKWFWIRSRASFPKSLLRNERFGLSYQGMVSSVFLWLLYIWRMKESLFLLASWFLHTATFNCMNNCDPLGAYLFVSAMDRVLNNFIGGCWNIFFGLCCELNYTFWGIHCILCLSQLLFSPISTCI